MAYIVTPGELRDRVTIERKTVTQAANGEPVTTWATIAELWAKVQQLTGREQIAAQQVQSPADARFVIRRRSGIAPDMHRIVWRGQPYDITGQPAEVGPRREWLEIMATAGVRDAR